MNKRTTAEHPVQTLVAATPKPVQFTTPESRDHILKPLRDAYEQAVLGVQANDRVAIDRRATKTQLGTRIREMQQQYEQAEYEERQAETYAVLGRNVVQDSAGFLSVAGVEVPAMVDPPAYPLEASQGERRGDVDPNPTGMQADPLDRFNAFHTEYTAENPEPEL